MTVLQFSDIGSLSKAVNISSNFTKINTSRFKILACFEIFCFPTKEQLQK